MTEELGHGQFGTVSRVTHTPTKLTMAMKVRARYFLDVFCVVFLLFLVLFCVFLLFFLFFQSFFLTLLQQEIPFANDSSTANSIIIELNVLVKSQSEFIVRFYGAFFNDTKVCYCMEFMDFGSLDRLYKNGVPEVVLARIAYSVRTVPFLRYFSSFC